MPRRGFFRGGGGGGEKKNSKKQHKLQQKVLAQEQKQQLHQQKRFSVSQSSSNNSHQQNNESDPPFGLNGPLQTAPSYINDSRVAQAQQGIHYQPSNTKSSPLQQSNSSYPALPTAAIDNAPQINYNEHHYHTDNMYHHDVHQQQQQQPQQQTHTLSTDQHYYQQNHQHFDESINANNFQQQQQQQHEYTPSHQQIYQTTTTPPFSSQTPPFSSQPYPGSYAESSPPQYPQTQYPPSHEQQQIKLLQLQQQQQELDAQMSQLQSQQQNILVQQQQQQQQQTQHYNRTLTVGNAVDEIWRTEPDDFRSASRAIQMLRMAIVNEWEHTQQQQQQQPQPKSSSDNFSYDPSDTFLSLQGATLRFHARFQSMKNERNQLLKGSGESIAGADNIGGASHHSGTTHSQSLNGVEYELMEQAAWEVLEESVRASAALTHACVGPAWRRQLKLRRQLISETEMRLLHQDYHLQQQHYQGRFGDNMSVGSSSFGGSSIMSSSFISMDFSNPQSSGRVFTTPAGGGGGGGGQGSVMTAPPVWQPPTDIIQMLSFPIPEVLPAAIIRFAGSVIEASIPPLRSLNTKIYWDSDNEQSLITSHLQDERRWIRRRKRLGDTQRDLAFGLFCGGNENENNNADSTAEAKEGDKSENQWSIPGAHTPTATMIHSWLETCAGWPIPREFEDSSCIPYHFEEISNEPLNDSLRESDSSEVVGDEKPPSEIVLQLNVDQPGGSNTVPDNTTSTTPEHVEPSYRKFTFWGELVTLQDDWWYTLRVLRDCSDLVSAGWRPPPKGRIGEGIVLFLISIAERGITHLAGSHGLNTELPEEQIRKERLVACSCASESLVAMKTLASREVIPQGALRPLALCLCQLISAAETSSNGSGEIQEEDDALFEKEILTQRTFVASSSAELLWVLLSSEATSCPTTDALLDAIDMDLSTEITDDNRAHVGNCVVIACGAIRALSAAMWGDPPSVRGVPLLRFFWEPVIDLYGAVASTFFKDVNISNAPTNITKKFSIASHESSIISVVEEQPLDYNSPFLSVVLEIVLSLQRLVDSEMVFGTGDLVGTEWESFIKAIDIGVAPWLISRGVESSSIALEIRVEALTIFSQITTFLESCSATGFHPIVDNEARQYLHLFLLRKIAPLLQALDTFSKPMSHPETVGDDATTLAFTVIKSWCVVRSLPFKDGDWAKRANELLSEAFAIPESQSIVVNRYIGGYLHHPLVRLEALKSLVDDESADNDYSLHGDSDSISTSGISNITPMSLKSGQCPPSFSLFSLTKNLRELHLVLVNSIILPRLEELLLITKPSIVKTSECQQIIQSNEDQPTAELFDVIEKEFFLRRYACKILGILFRSRTGEGEKRHYFIELLQKVATSTPHGIRNWVSQREKEVEHSSAVGFTFSPSQLLRGEERNLRLEAIRQLEACLDATFTSLPHTHANVPQILKALCETARFYSTGFIEDPEHRMGETDNRLMTLASILPCARLSCARNGHVMLIPRHHVTQNIPEDILSIVSVNTWIHSINLEGVLPIVSEENDFNSEHGEIAPFLFVKNAKEKDPNHSSQSSSSGKHSRRRQTRRSSSHHLMDGKQGTLVDLEPVASTIKHILQAASEWCCQSSLPSSSEFDDEEEDYDRTLSPTSIRHIPSILCTISYTVLSLFWSRGMAFPSEKDKTWLDITPSTSCDHHDHDNNELISRSQAVSDFAGVLGHLILSRIGSEENNLQLVRRVCKVLVEQSKSQIQKVVQQACCGLISLLSSLRHSFGKRTSSTDSRDKFDDAITGYLVEFIEHVCSVLKGESASSDFLLIPLIDAMREASGCADTFFKFPASLRRKAFLNLFRPTRDQWEIQVVAFQCVVAIINSMDVGEASLMLFCAIGPKDSEQLSNQQRIQPLLIDLLRYRLMSARLLKLSGASSEVDDYKPSLVHERLARETLALETFPVDLDDLGVPKVAAWKVGNAILMLRMGSKDSSYRGWLEVVLRTPCSRIRRLVKWRKEAISKCPTNFLPYWDQLNRSKPEQNAIKQESSTTDLVDGEESIAIMTRAKSIIARFDDLVDGASPQQQSDEKNNSPSKLEKSSGSNTFLHRRNSKPAFGEKKGNDKLKRTFSDGGLVSMPTSTQPKTLHVKKRSVYSWLQHATCLEEIDVDLIRQLEMLGFSSLALGVPNDSTEDIPSSTSYPDLFVCEKLKPYTIGPNFNRAVSILERVVPFQTHRIALFYGGPFSTTKNSASKKSETNSNSCDGDNFLMSTQASTDFWEFARDLGDLVPVRHLKYFSGGLDISESDGAFTFVSFGCQGGSYELNDPILVDSMCVFHTVTLMPDRLTNRKRHVGNDVVHIVYGLDVDTLDVDHERMAVSGHFGFITIYVIPLVHVPLFKVSVHLKAGLASSICSALDHLVGSWLISTKIGGHFVRNLAMQADVICQSMIEDKLGLVLNTEDRAGRIRETERHLG